MANPVRARLVAAPGEAISSAETTGSGRQAVDEGRARKASALVERWRDAYYTPLQRVLHNVLHNLVLCNALHMCNAALHTCVMRNPLHMCNTYIGKALHMCNALQY